MNRTTAMLAIACLAATTAIGADEPGKDPKSADTRTKPDLAAEAKEDFARADKNGDGYLKNEEVVKGWLERYDLDGDGKISRTEFVEVSSRPLKLRAPSPMRDPRARAMLAIATFDANKDGIIQKSEYPGDQVKFRGFDRNKDDALSFQELISMTEDELADIKKKMKSPSRYEFLPLFDVDGDRNVGLDEYDGPMESFKKFDKDGDGVVTYDELYPELMMERMKKAAEMGPHPEDLTVVEAMDKNKDGKVARDEFKGTDDAWKRLDRNGDGVLTIIDSR